MKHCLLKHSTMCTFVLGYQNIKFYISVKVLLYRNKGRQNQNKGSEA
jgi:hypothetical protein